MRISAHFDPSDDEPEEPVRRRCYPRLTAAQEARIDETLYPDNPEPLDPPTYLAMRYDQGDRE